ncbi:serine/threonine-protein kinase Chk1-like [Oratosquilla oratoria]|uniref:serine/threonine-protein kinase Chk1-like n=1 Tax=Oratosquilla oratoria TaxID=337810 RepID=UPI003F77287A
MKSKFLAQDGASGAEEAAGMRTARNINQEFETRVRHFVRERNDEERQRLLTYFNSELDFFLDAGNQRTFHENKEHLVRVVAIVRILLEETARSNVNLRQCNKRKHCGAHDATKAFKKLKTSVERGTWEIVRLLGRGSFGSVHLVQDVTTGGRCARKTITIDQSGRQLEEIKIHRELVHRNVVAFLGGIQDRNVLYIFLEFVSGGTLEDRIGPQGVSEKKARFYFKQLISGVKYLHSCKVTHRDLKPENLFVSKHEDLKIGDFGLAGKFDRAKFLWRVCGTPGYIAPEVYTGRYRGEPVDLWSCGIILFQLLTGQTPWEDSTTRYPTFALWCSSTSEMRLRRPWRSLSNDHFFIVKKLLAPNAKYRATISDIQKNHWFRG